MIQWNIVTRRLATAVALFLAYSLPAVAGVSLDDAVKLHAAAKLEQAVGAYREVIQTSRDTEEVAKARFGLAGAYLSLKNYDAAVEAFQEAATWRMDNPDGPLALVFAGNARAEQGRIDDARSYYEKALKVEQADFNMIVWSAWAHLGMGNVLVHCQKYEDSLPHLVDAMEQAQEPRVLSEAASLLAKAYANLDPSAHSVSVNKAALALGTYNHNQKNYAQALPYLQHVTAQATDGVLLGDGYIMLGECYMHLGRNDECLKAFRAVKQIKDAGPLFRAKRPHFVGVATNDEALMLASQGCGVDGIALCDDALKTCLNAEYWVTKELRQTRVRCLIGAGELDRAEQAIHMDIDGIADPDKEAGLLGQLADAYRGAKRYSDAIRISRETRNFGNEYRDSLPHLVRTMEHAQEPSASNKAADSLAKAFAALDPTLSAGHSALRAAFALGRYYHDQKKYAQALPYLQYVVARAADEILLNNGSIMLAESLRALGREDEAVGALKSVKTATVLGDDPEDKALTIQTMQSCIAVKDWQNVCLLAEEMQRGDPADVATWGSPLIIACLDTRQYEKAIPVCKSIVASVSEGRAVVEALTVLAECMYALGKGEDAVAFQKQYYDSHADRKVEAVWMRARMAYYAEKDYSKAATLFDEFISTYAHDPLEGQARELLAFSLEGSGQTDRAAAAFRNLLDNSSAQDKANLTKRLADIYFKGKKYREAAEVYRAALRIAATSLDYRSKITYQLALCYKESGLIRPATTYMQRVVDMYPNTESARDARGALYVWSTYGAKTVAK